MDKFTHCVKCGAEKTPDLECPACGAIYAKAEAFCKPQPPKVQPCPACGGTLSVNASACPHCGEPQILPEKQQEPVQDPLKSPLSASVGLSTILGSLALAAFFTYVSVDNDRKPADMSIMAGIHCRDFVKQRLKSPSTADFPYLGTPTWKTGNTYAVKSYVDSQNSFGVMVRSNWTCKIKYVTGDKYDRSNWQLIDLEIL
jgi:hypothetical protein